MSISQPSREIYVIDVPEVKNFSAQYHYNFFVPDEQVNEVGGVPSNILSRAAAEVDAHFIQYSITRVPRFVQFSWHKPRIADVGNMVTEQVHKANTHRTTGEQYGSLILDNLDKIVNEDDFASNHYVSVHFHDSDIDTKIYELASGSMVQQTLQQPHDPNVSHYKAAQRLIPMLPYYIKPHWIYRAMTLPHNAYGAQFYLPAGSHSSAHGSRQGHFHRQTGVKVMNHWFNRLKEVTVNTQINAKMMHDLINRSIVDPASSNAQSLVNMHHYSKQVKQASNQRFMSSLSENEFKSFVPFISVHKHGISGHREKYGVELVGYIIDKFEVLKDGTIKAHAPIVIDNAHVNVTADYKVKFNTTYCYTIRAIALFKLPAIDDDTGNIATIRVLVSSKPSNKIYVSTLKLDAPPPPADINFVWNYETNKLMVQWAFPVTSERDIKQFQVFRRENVNVCFELQKVYNFDDSVVKFPSAESPDPKLVEYLKSPATYWIDDEFDWNVHNSKENSFIYSICAIDAHGLTSNYSAQYRVWFDRFKNKLQKELVSHAGAPKPYPNMYLEGDLFENTIRVQGEHSKRMKIYFNPEYYYLIDDKNRFINVLQTKQTGGGYKLQFINVDNLKSAAIDIIIDDRMPQTIRRLAYPMISFGQKRKTQKQS
jgi:hypothetical protein